jgi:LmbE family N-acetylglucosaminyl deacetylase
MSNFNLFCDKNSKKRILCLGAHCDDIEIGCGGSLLEITKNYPDVELYWAIFSSTPERRKEAETCAKLFANNASLLNISIFDFRDGFLPHVWAEVKEKVEKTKQDCPNPDLIFTHCSLDKHQDHRLISELTWNTFRDHNIFEYEIPKWDGDLSTPNTYLTLSDSCAREKIKYLQKAYNSQKTKKWFTDDLFWSLMRIRGMESNSDTNLSEAFYTKKMVFSG